jgi:tetratricopeptide (TPR) repeat protein
MDALATLGRPVPLIAVQFVVAGFHPGLSVDTILRRLIDIHMVTLDRMSRMVALNPIDQDYVYQRLAQDGEYSRNALDCRAADYYAQLQAPRDRWQSTVDLGPYLLEFEHRFRAGQYEAAAQVLNLIDMEFAAWRGHTRRLQTMYQRLDGKLQNPRLQMLQAYSLGLAHIFLGPLEKAVECFETARCMAQKIRDCEFERKATGWLGDAARRLGRLDQAIKELSLAVSMSPADVAPQNTLMLTLGLAHAYKGEFQQAIECGLRLLDLADRHSDPVLRAQAHDVLSIACLVSRDFTQALVHARYALDLYKVDDFRDPLAYVLNVQGMAYFGQGRLREAIDSFEEARSRGREDDLPRVEGFSLFNLSRALRVKGEPGRALEMAELASTVLTRIGAPEAAAAAAFRDALTACAAGGGHAMARALLICGGCCALNADLCAPCDLFAEAEEIARAEGLSTLAQEAGIAAKELNCLSAAGSE